MCTTIFLEAHAFAANELAQSFTLDGQLMLAGTTTVLSDSAAVLKIDILDPTKTCVLYEETQTVNTVSSDGYFSIQVGSVTGASKRTGSDPGLTMVQVFQNTTAVAATSTSGATCSGNTYTPTADSVRYFRITVTPSSTNVADVLSPDTTIDAAPMAMVAQTLQGYQATDFLAKAGLPTCSSGTFLSYDGTTLSCAGVAGASGGTVTSITAGTGLTGGTITASGTIALATSGATAGTYGSTSAVPVITVDTYGRVTNVTTASISGSPSGTASGDLSGTYPSPTVNGLNGTALSISSLTSGQYLKYNGTNWINSTLSVSDSQITYASEAANTFFAAPNGSAGTPTFRTIAAADLPTVPYTRGGTGLTATPANGQIAIGNGAGYTLGTLTAGTGVTITNTAGSVTIAASGSGGTVTSVTGTAPISIATGTSTPVVSISQATSSSDGYLSSADWTTFNSKMGSALASGDIFVGNSSGAAMPVAMSGDATLSSAGALTLATVATAGTYEKVIVNAKGLVTSGSSLGSSDITTALGYTPVNKAGDSMSGNLTHAASTGDIYTAGSGSNTVIVEGPSGAIGTSYVLRLPTAVASAAGQVLTSDTSGNLSWSTPSTTATSYSGILPIANGGTNSSAALTGNQVMISSGGKIIEGGAMANGQLMIGSGSGVPIPATLTAGSGITITNAANSITIASSGSSMPALPSADIFVGNSSGGAAAVAMSGDVTITNAGVTTVGKLQGTTLSATTPTTAGQVLRYNGSAWAPNFVSMADLRSTITGASALVSCSASQTLTWSSATDNLACSNIAISDSQITYGSEAANTFLAAPNGSSGTPTYRTIASADLPSGTLTGTGTANYVPYYSTATTLANSPMYVSGSSVGIGTTSPSEPFQVIGNSRFGYVGAEDATWNNGSIYYYNDSSYAGIELQNRGTWGGSGSWMRIWDDNGNTGNLLSLSMGNSSNTTTGLFGLVHNTYSSIATSLGSGGSGNGRIFALGTSNNNSMVFGTDNVERMRITAAGNVGIGTTSPVTYLQVAKAPTATANYPLLALGSGAFDGATTGYFIGNASGTMIGVNAASGYTGDLINLQIAGVSKFKVDASGNITSSGTTTSSGNTTSTGNYSTSGNIATTGTGTITSAGSIADSSTTASTSSTTGALTVAGGAGISGALYTGSTISSAGNITSGADFLAAYGTAAAPSYAYTSDTTTGVFAPSAGILAFSAGGLERMRMNSSGYVGVGTTSPTYPLDVENNSSSGSTIKIKNANSAGYSEADFYDSSNNFQSFVSWDNSAAGNAPNAFAMGTTGAYPLELITNSTTRVTVSSSGSVGIGTTSPYGALQVTNSTGIDPWGMPLDSVVIGNITHTNWSGSGIAMSNGATGSDIGLIGYNGNGMYFGQMAGTGAASQQMILTSSGWVGIGTTNPVTTLEVRPGTNENLYISPPQAFATGISMFSVNDANTSTEPWQLGASEFEFSGGNVGIGTAPTSYTLQVNGSVAGTSAYVNYSDQKLKKNIQTIPDALKKIDELRGVTFDWRQKEYPDLKLGKRQELGVIAQEVEKVFPQAVSEDKTTGIKSVAYSMLIGPLIEAVKEIHQILHSQDRDIASLKEENATLKTELCRKDPTYSFCAKGPSSVSH